MSNILAEISPNPLSIIITKNNENKKISSLILKNITNKYIVYKFLINNKGVLLAKPSTSFIPPLKSINIEIHVINNNISNEELNKTKILIMFIQSNEEIRTIEEAKKIYQILKNEENEKQETLVNLKIINEKEENEENNNYEIENYENNNQNERITYINYSQLKNELVNKNNEIKKNLEIQRKRLENLVSQNNKYNNVNDKGKRKKFYNFDNLILTFIILIGLIIGSNFACGYNKLFKKK